MLTTKFRTTLVAAIAAAGVLAATGVAQSSDVSGSSYKVKYNTAITKGTFNLTSLTKRAGGPTYVDPIVRNGEVIAYVSGYGSGGSWDDDQCQAAGAAINDLLGLALDSFSQGDLGSAAVYAQEAEAATNQAMDEGGCGIKHTKEAPPEKDPDPVIL